MQRPQKFSSSSDSSASPTPPGGHSPQHTANRPESKAELKPLFTQTPLSFAEREKKPSQPPRKRRKQEPKTPALTFNPLQSTIPSGRQESPAQTPVFHQGQPTPISTTDEFSDLFPEGVDNQPAYGVPVPSHATTSKRPRAPSGSDESPQPPSYSVPVPYSDSRFVDHSESPSSGGSSSSPATSYDPFPHPLYGLDNGPPLFHPAPIDQYCDPNDYQSRREPPDVYSYYSGMYRGPSF
ncbi:hypothetical protein K503DRAFT_861699 [Rhizopogon vinicolor AM-OR11-026]|uniref:Uncharacterized protein n=1 Tax=Rhizopogon vinicolor AM-OR11-026 TaxID=1314800 RepID=A0A1B7NGZ5_9AGAM|nr:hypothetical protein K503DRAFT_861699 [Rhizopogon vinicolor AM-OR11-026]